jgi:hypothetical protein
MLHARPSLRILFSCSIVTFGFFIGVFLDAIPMSLVGISFGVTSSAITALHSVVIKKSLDVVKGSALHLSWYTNLLSLGIFIPLMLVVGELPEVTKLLFEPEVAPGDPNAGLGKLGTFLWGSLITVSTLVFCSFPASDIICYAGNTWIYDELSEPVIHQGDFTHYPHGFERRAWCRGGCAWYVDLRRCPQQVSTYFLFMILVIVCQWDDEPYSFTVAAHHQ